jgi:uncharacterized protein (DUF2249 family)
MNILREAIYNHHRRLQETLREHVDALVNRRVDAGEFVAFLKRELLSRARSEERHLYSAVDTLVREHGRPTATMAVDHEFFADYAQRIEGLNDALILENPDEQAVPKALLRQLAVELEVVVQLHLMKEDRVYLPLFEQYMTNGEQRTLLDKIRETYEEEASMATENILDVREATPRERHPLILRTFEKLNPGESFVLVNDHDPKPLYSKFQAEWTGRFSWDYLEQGPEVWRVRIGKTG